MQNVGYTDFSKKNIQFGVISFIVIVKIFDTGTTKKLFSQGFLHIGLPSNADEMIILQ